MREKIIAMEPLDHIVVGAVKLKLENGQDANMVPSWIADWKPQVGGYFVVVGKGDARYEA